MSSFTAPLELRLWPSSKDKFGYDVYVTAREFAYRIDNDYDRLIIVPKDTPTNLGTVPPGFRWLLPEITEPDGYAVQCTVLHDYLVGEFQGKELPLRDQGTGRQEAHRIFLQSLEVMGLPKWKRRIVRIGLWFGDRYARWHGRDIS